MNYPYLTRKVSKGRTYWYFRRAGKWIRLPDPDHPRFLTEYNRLKGSKDDSNILRGSIADAIRSYRKSARFSRLSASTRAQREVYLKRIQDEYADYNAGTMMVTDVDDIMEQMADRPGVANNYLVALSEIMRQAIRMGYRTDNPCALVERNKSNPIPPWPEDVLKAALENATPMMRLAISLGYYTGQRISDCVKMRHNDRKDGFIYVKQQKTGKELWIREHARLTDTIRETPKRAVTILYNRSGKPFSTKTLQSQVRCYVGRLGCGGYTFHGLRKNAVIALLEAGNEVPSVAAITGQTYEYVEYYAQQINQKKMGSAAILKWEKEG